MAVYTPLSDDDIDVLLGEYDLGTRISAEGITAGVENTNYKLTLRSPHGLIFHYILTVFEKRMNTDDLPFFTQILQVLSEMDFPSPIPMKRIDGRLLSQVKNKPALIVSFLEGESIMRPGPRHLELLGDVAAQMQELLQGFTPVRPNALSIDGWHLLHGVMDESLNTVTPGLANLIKSELKYLRENWPEDLPRGIIHADLFPDNVFFATIAARTHLTGVIDFYFACEDFLAYELAVIINAWCFDSDWRFLPNNAVALFSAYQNVRPLTQAERNAFPALVRGAALRFLLTRAYDVLHTPDDADVNVKDPKEYLAKLLFHQGMRRIEDYGWLG